MKKIIMSMMLGVIAMVITGCSNEIDLVKDGTMSFDKSLTIGEAFDNWSNCIEQDWEIIETDNGKKVVQFTGIQVIEEKLFTDLEKIGEFADKWLALEKEKEDLDLEGVKKGESMWDWLEVHNDKVISLKKCRVDTEKEVRARVERNGWITTKEEGDKEVKRLLKMDNFYRNCNLI